MATKRIDLSLLDDGLKQIFNDSGIVIASEGSRVTAETARGSNETTRLSSETARGVNEVARLASEVTRVSSEATRGTNETARVTVENIRGTNETTRIASEGVRVTSELARVVLIESKAPKITPVFDGATEIIGTIATDSPTFGAELLTGGTWTSIDWTGDNAVGFTHVAGNTTPLSYSVPVVIGNLYQITVTKTGATTGTSTMTIGEAVAGTISGTNGTYAHGPKALTTVGLVIIPITTFNGTIVISVKQITGISTPLFLLKSSNATTRMEVRANTGLNNTFLGFGSGRYNTTGSSNVASGYSSLYSNTTGSSNVASGYFSLYSNTTGNYNVASGYFSLYYNTTGSYNVASGYASLQSNTTGSYNLASGYASLYSNTTGSSNVALGHFAGYHASQKIDAMNSMALGANTYTTASNQIVLGSAAVTEIQFGQGSFLGNHKVNSINIKTAKTPASATDTGIAGDICWDANFIYTCVAANTWKRAAIATW